LGKANDNKASFQIEGDLEIEQACSLPSYRAQEVANNGSLFTTDFRDLYYGNDIEW